MKSKSTCFFWKRFIKYQIIDNLGKACEMRFTSDIITKNIIITIKNTYGIHFANLKYI